MTISQSGSPTRLPQNWPVRTALRLYIQEQVPGWSFKARMNGGEFATFPGGEARLPDGGTAGMPMTEDTIVHAASMSKPVCITAYVAMLEDWQTVVDAIHGLSGLRRSPTTPVEFDVAGGGHRSIAIPIGLLSMFSSATMAERLILAGLSHVLPPALMTTVSDFAEHRLSPAQRPASVLGFEAYVRAVIAGRTVPGYDDPFLPLISAELQARATSLGVPYAIGSDVGAITIRQLILHQTPLRNGITDQSMYTLIPSAEADQPVGGVAVFDLWSYVLAFLEQDADGQPGYKNDDYTVLGALVQALTGMAYDDYVTARLFADARFGDIRRYVVTPDAGALYYDGTGPNWTGGVLFCDYRGWSAAGGFYYTARQITDWLYALYARTPVAGATGDGPLLSEASRDLLFGSDAFFAAGAKNVVNGWTTYTHDGGTGFGGGSANGNLGVALSGTDVMTVFFGANGSINGAEAYEVGFAACVRAASMSRVPTPVATIDD